MDYEYDDLDEWLDRERDGALRAMPGIDGRENLPDDPMARRLAEAGERLDQESALPGVHIPGPQAPAEDPDPDLDMPPMVVSDQPPAPAPEVTHGDIPPPDQVAPAQEPTQPQADDFDAWIAQQAAPEPAAASVNPGGQRFQPADLEALDAAREMDDERLGEDEGGGTGRELRRIVAALSDGYAAGSGRSSDNTGAFLKNEERLQRQQERGHRQQAADRQQRRKELLEADARDRERRQMDPSSPESQSVHVGLARALGGNPEDYGHISAHDFEQQRSLFDMQFKSLQRQEAARRAAETREAQRRQALEDEARRKEAEIEKEIRTGNTAGDKRDRAALVAGMRAKAAEDAHARRLELEKKKDADRKSDKLDDRVRQMGDALRLTGLPKMRQKIDRLRKRMEDASRRNGGPVWDQRDNLARRMPSETWGVGMSQEGAEIAAELQELRNLAIKDLSGAAVSASEMGRIMSAQGGNMFDSEETLRAWFQNLDDAYNEDYKNVLSSGGPAVYQRYLDNKTAIDAMVNGEQGAHPVSGAAKPKTIMVNGREVEVVE